MHIINFCNTLYIINSLPTSASSWLATRSFGPKPNNEQRFDYNSIHYSIMKISTIMWPTIPQKEL